MKHKQQTLLELALSTKAGYQKGRNPSREETELAIAFLHGTVTMAQASFGFNLPSKNNLYTTIVPVLRGAIRKGLLEIKLKGEQK